MKYIITQVWRRVSLGNFHWYIARKKKFSIKDFLSKYEQILGNLRSYSDLLKKSSRENFVFLTLNTDEKRDGDSTTYVDLSPESHTLPEIKENHCFTWKIKYNFTWNNLLPNFANKPTHIFTKNTGLGSLKCKFILEKVN